MHAARAGSALANQASERCAPQPISAGCGGGRWARAWRGREARTGGDRSGVGAAPQPGLERRWDPVLPREGFPGVAVGSRSPAGGFPWASGSTGVALRAPLPSAALR